VAKSKFLKRPVRPVEIIQGAEVSELLSRMGETAFQGKNLAIAVDVWEQMLRGDVTIFFGLAGAMVPGGLRQTIRDMIDLNIVDVLVSTGANLYHDLHEAMGFHHYLAQTEVPDVELAKLRIDRIFDVYASDREFNHSDLFIKKFADALPPRRYSSREFLQLLVQHPVLLDQGLEFRIFFDKCSHLGILAPPHRHLRIRNDFPV